MEKDRGVALTQHHLLSLKGTGNDIKALEEFRTKFDYIYQALDVGGRPTDSAMRSLMFEQLKNHPKMALVIDKFRNASSSSSKRTAQWFYEKMVSRLTRIFHRWGQRLMLHPTSPTNQEKGTKLQKVIRIPSHRNLQSLTSLTNLRSLTNLTDKGAKEVDAAAAKGKGKKGDKGRVTKVRVIRDSHHLQD